MGDSRHHFSLVRDEVFERFNEVERLWRYTTCKLFIRSSEGRRAEGAGGQNTDHHRPTPSP